MDLRNCVVVSPDGTYFPAYNAMILDTSELTDDEVDTLCEGTDSDRWDLAIEWGGKLSELID